MGAPYYGPQPVPQPYPPQPYNPEADSIKSMVNIASIFGLLIAIGGILWGLWSLWSWSQINAYLDYLRSINPGIDYYDSYVYAAYQSALMWALIYGVLGILMFVFGLMFYFNCNAIKTMVSHGQYIQAKSKTLVWVIVGFIFAGVLPGIILLIAYLKFDPLIRSGMHPMAPPPQEMRVCTSCGRQIPVNYNVCPHCGKAVAAAPQQAPTGYGYQSEMRACMGCGRQIPAAYATCPHCGRPANPNAPPPGH
jgi:RNA polymerase subunit RPABC4/transcription elongation factor Spt4